jgi:hypothetical protein
MYLANYNLGYYKKNSTGIGGHGGGGLTYVKGNRL